MKSKKMIGLVIAGILVIVGTLFLTGKLMATGGEFFQMSIRIWHAPGHDGDEHV